MRPSDSLIRASLWLSVPFNLFAAYALAQPGSLPGRLIGLPHSVPPLYAVLTALFVVLFGLAYAWLATRPSFDRALLGFAACGKASVFVAALVMWILQSGAGATVVVASGDLLLAALWFGWLWAGRGPGPEG